MKRRFEFHEVNPPTIVERVARTVADGALKRFALGFRKDVLRTFDRASARAVACLVAAALFIAAMVLLVHAGLLGLLAAHVPPTIAYLVLGVLALAGGWLLLRAPSEKPDPDDPR